MFTTYDYSKDQNRTTTTYSFGVKDERGREMGAQMETFVRTFHALPEDARGGCTAPAGTFFMAIPWTLRDGKTFGPIQTWHRFETLEERNAYIDKYLKDACKRAAKKSGSEATIIELNPDDEPEDVEDVTPEGTEDLPEANETLVEDPEDELQIAQIGDHASKYAVGDRVSWQDAAGRKRKGTIVGVTPMITTSSYAMIGKSGKKIYRHLEEALTKLGTKKASNEPKKRTLKDVFKDIRDVKMKQAILDHEMEDLVKEANQINGLMTTKELKDLYNDWWKRANPKLSK